MAANDRPNILWISLEDTSPRFGCYGDDVARTPNLDALAAQGRIYRRAFSVAGVCAPSRSSIITGCYPTWLGTHHMRTTHRNETTPEMATPYSAVLPHMVRPFPEYLRAVGYYCTNNEKTDYQFTPPRTTWDELGPEAHWRTRPEGMPFFAVFNPTVTHESGMWPREDEQVATDPDAVSLPPYIPDTPKSRLALARHYDNIERADARVGELLQQLEEDGLADNTVVFIWSDHGEGLPRAKRWVYDQGIRIPLIVRWPGHIPAGETTDELVSLVSLGPTMLSLADVDCPAHMQARPFLGPDAHTPEYVYAARDRFDESHDMVRAVRDARFKYIRNYCPEKPRLLWIPYRNRHPMIQELWRLHAEDALPPEQQVMLAERRPVEELYDTERDPWELNNMARDPEHTETLARLRGALDAWRVKHDALGEVSEADMVNTWYPGGTQPRTGGVVFVPISPASPGTAAMSEGGVVEGPCLLQLHCATQGAAIAYTTEPGDDVAWKLYTGPIRLPAGATTVRARANRVGYEESEERSACFSVT